MTRTYERSHPWLRFSVDLSRAPVQLWMMLGEAASKCEHIAGVPLKPETAAQLHFVYLAKGVRATTAIEGNTLSEEEVQAHLAGELRLPPSKEYLAKEIDNIIAVCNGIWRQCAQGGSPALTVELIKAYNARVLQGLEVEPEVVPGGIREHSVGVARYRGAPAEDCEYLLHRLCEWLNEPDFAAPLPATAAATAAAILKAILAHLYLSWIHPFGDGNGRTARLVEFLILACAGVPSPTGHLLSNHYNETRSEYYRQLDRASQSGGDTIPFICYAVEGFVDGLKMQLAKIRHQQYEVAWTNYVHERFHDQDTEADQRRRRLVLDLSKSERPVRFSALFDLSPKVASYYAQRTPRTLTRDLKYLAEMNLVVYEDGGWRANKGLIMAFLPFRSPQPAPDLDWVLPGEPEEEQLQLL